MVVYVVETTEVGGKRWRQYPKILKDSADWRKVIEDWYEENLPYLPTLVCIVRLGENEVYYPGHGWCVRWDEGCYPLL